MAEPITIVEWARRRRQPATLPYEKVLDMWFDPKRPEVQQSRRRRRARIEDDRTTWTPAWISPLLPVGTSADRRQDQFERTAAAVRRAAAALPEGEQLGWGTYTRLRSSRADLALPTIDFIQRIRKQLGYATLAEYFAAVIGANTEKLAI